MLRRLDQHDIVDIEWAHGMVAKGVKAISLLNRDLICEPDEVEAWLDHIIETFQTRNGYSQISACYLDLLKEPERLGREFTGGDLLSPVIGAVQTSSGSYAVFFAANETMADLFRWAFDIMRQGSEDDKNRAHAIIGLLCGYSPLAIEGFMCQPDGVSKVIAHIRTAD